MSHRLAPGGARGSGGRAGAGLECVGIGQPLQALPCSPRRSASVTDKSLNNSWPPTQDTIL